MLPDAAFFQGWLRGYKNPNNLCGDTTITDWNFLVVLLLLRKIDTAYLATSLLHSFDGCSLTQSPSDKLKLFCKVLPCNNEEKRNVLSGFFLRIK